MQEVQTVTPTPTSNTDIPVVPPPVQQHQVTYAGLWVRVGANSCDFLIYEILFLLPGVILLFFRRFSGAGSSELVLYLQAVMGFFLAVTAAIEIFFNIKFGGTIGKLFFHIKIVDKENQIPNLKSVIIRQIVKNLPQLVGIMTFVLKLPFLQYLSFPLGFDNYWMLRDRRKQTIHDKIAGTFVIFTQPVSSVKRVLILVITAIAFFVLILLSAAIYLAFFLIGQ